VTFTGLSVGAARQRLGQAEPDPELVTDLTDVLAAILDPTPRAMSA